jgi:hypothetical protein
MSNLPTITSVSQSINIETPNQATPNVTIASGSVSSFRIGFKIVFSTPNTAAARINVPAEWWNVTPVSNQPATPSAAALTAQERAKRARNDISRDRTPLVKAAATVPPAHLSSLSPDDDRYRGDDHVPRVQAREHRDDANERVSVLLQMPELLCVATAISG